MSGVDLTPEERALFLQEAREQLEAVEAGLLALEERPDDAELVAGIFRAMHTLKGGAGTAGYVAMANLAHSLETLLDRVRSGTLRVSGALTDLLLSGVDGLNAALTALEDDEEPDDRQLEALAAQVEAWERGDAGASGAAEEVAPAAEAAVVPSPASPQGASPAPSRAASGSGVPAGEGAGGAVATGAAVATAEADRAESPSPDASLEPIRAALAEGRRVTRWVIEVARDAAIPSLRAYQALLILGERGDVLASEPTAEALSDSDIDAYRLTAYLAAEGDLGPLRDELAHVAEIAQVTFEECRAVPDEAAGRDGATETAPAAASAAQGATKAAQATRDGRPKGAAAPDANEPGAGPGASRTLGQTIRIDVSLLDRFMNLVGELVVDRTRLSRLADAGYSLSELRQEIGEVAGRLNRITNDLQDVVMQARMMPVSVLFRKFPRMVRDLARQLNKSVDFRMYGEDTELDRSVIEQIGDPLMHLLRNAVDHGLEPPEERVRAGKPPEGRVELRAYHRENWITIEVRDDGRGIDPAVVRRKAIQNGWITEDEHLSEDEVIDLILRPGFTTAQQLSQVSGRGVGLDVVKRSIEAVNGTLEVETTLGEGTLWIIKLPLTLAIVQALLGEIAGQVFAVPLAQVVEIFRLDSESTYSMQGWKVFEMRGRIVPILNPGRVWGEAYDTRWSERRPNLVVVLQSGGAPIGLHVDSLIGEEEIVMKSLGPLVGQLPGISGASILGDGRVALIIDVSNLTKVVKSYGSVVRG